MHLTMLGAGPMVARGGSEICVLQGLVAAPGTAAAGPARARGEASSFNSRPSRMQGPRPR